MNRRFVLLLILAAIASSLLFAEPAHSSITKPSVPEFTVRFEANPYDVSPIYGIDEYTGKNVTIQEGFHVENRNIVITIENQPLDDLYYNVRYKGHFGGNWKALYSYPRYDAHSRNDIDFLCDTDKMYCGSNPEQNPNSENTILIIRTGADDVFVSEDQIDFQVQALLWVPVEVWVLDHIPMFPGLSELGHYEQRFRVNATSEWSPTKTIIISAPLSPILSETLIVIAVAASIGLAIYIIKRKQAS